MHRGFLFPISLPTLVISCLFYPSHSNSEWGSISLWFWGIPLTVLCISLTVSECWRIDAFEPWCWRRLMRVPWTARRSNQSLLKEISSEYSLEGLMLKQKLWPPDAKNWLIGKDPDAEKDWRQEEKGMTEDEMLGWHHRLDGHEFEQAPGVGDAAVHGVAKSQMWLSD